MGLVEGVLLFPAALGFIYGPAHGWGDSVGVQNHLAVGIARRPADGLDQRGLRAQEALLVRVQDSHQGYLRQVQPLSEQVNAHQHVELAQPQVPDDLHALDGVDVVVHIPHPDACALEVVGEALRHLLGEGGHQHPFVPGGSLGDLPDEVVDLPVHRADLHPGVQEPRGPDDLLHNLARAGPLVLAGGGGDIHHLVEPFFKLVELQRAVIEGAGQAEAVLHQGGFPGPVAVEHGPHLGEGGVALVDEEHKVFWEIVQQGMGRRPHWTALDHPGVIFDAGAVAQLLHHLNVVHGALLDALGLDEPVFALEKGHPLLHLLVYVLDGGVHLLLGGDIVGGGPDGDVIQPPDGRPRHHVDFGQAVDLVPEELHPDGGVLPVGRPDLHRVPPHPEHIALEGDVVALVADGH